MSTKAARRDLVVVYLPRPMADALRDRADRHGDTVSRIIERVLEEAGYPGESQGPEPTA